MKRPAKQRARRRRTRVGVLERRNPIPAGRYWMDATGDPAIDKLDAWLVAHTDTVRVVTSEFDRGSAGPFSNPTPVQFVIFQVSAPTRSDGLPSYPNIATPDIQTSADTVQRPPPETMPSVLDVLAIPFEGAGMLLALWVFYELTKDR
jgi:hypothetical protein